MCVCDLLDELEELLFELVDLVSDEEGVYECEICIRKVAVVPDLLCYKEGAQNEGTPVSWL
jgi:hypothetical protein